MGNMKQFVPQIKKDKLPEFTNPDTKHPKAKGFLLAKVPADVEIIIQVASEVYATELHIIDITKDIPAYLPSVVKMQIKKFLSENDFDSKDGDVCIISPFVQNFRAFIVEIFKRSDAEEYIERLIDRGFTGTIKGMIFKQGSNNTTNKKYFIDSKTDAHVRKDRRIVDETNEYAIKKAREINRRLW